MKIDRVLLVSNSDPVYYEFWNLISFIYKTKFDINPTLIFFGTEEESKNLNLSKEFGEIIVEKKIEVFPNWQYTWALFYFTKFYLNETCIIMGIDQIPLGTQFLKDFIQGVEDDKYVMLIDDQYKLEKKWPKKWDEGGFSPSAYHIAKGKTFDDIFKFEDTFESELRKLVNAGFPTMWDNGWGTDEAYSSNMLRLYKDRHRIVDLSKSKFFLENRIDCHRIYEPSYDLEKLKNNGYVECHSCRPYSSHIDYLNKMINNIPNFV